MTRLSILMACYMQEKYVEEAIDSVLKCGYDFKDSEIILWDDCSTDRTWEILQSYAARYPGIVRALRSEANMGVADCAAAMVNAARGKYVMMFDHDDVLLPFNIAGELDFLDQNPGYVASYGRKLMFDDETGLQGRSMGGPYTDFLMILHPPINNNALIMRRETVLKVGNFTTTREGKLSGAADIFMWLRLRLAGNLRYDNTPRLLHRIHKKQVTQRDKQSEVYIRDYRFFLDYMIERYPELYQKLLSGKDMNVSGEEMFAALILLGGMIRNTNLAADIDRFLYYAKQLAPEDPAVDQQIGEFMFNIGHYEDSAFKFADIYVKFEDDYQRLIALAGLVKAYEKLERPTDFLHAGGVQLSRRYFTLSPENRRVLMNLRHYNK